MNNLKCTQRAYKPFCTINLGSEFPLNLVCFGSILDKTRADESLLILLGDQLFPIDYIRQTGCRRVFMAEDFLGEVGETEEAIPRWTKISQIPYDMMWEDDEHWLPRMLEGECFSGHFFFESERIRWMKMDWDVDYPG